MLIRVKQTKRKRTEEQSTTNCVFVKSGRYLSDLSVPECCLEGQLRFGVAGQLLTAPCRLTHAETQCKGWKVHTYNPTCNIWVESHWIFDFHSPNGADPLFGTSSVRPIVEGIGLKLGRYRTTGRGGQFSEVPSVAFELQSAAPEQSINTGTTISPAPLYRALDNLYVAARAFLCMTPMLYQPSSIRVFLEQQLSFPFPLPANCTQALSPPLSLSLSLSLSSLPTAEANFSIFQF